MTLWSWLELLTWWRQAGNMPSLIPQLGNHRCRACGLRSTTRKARSLHIGADGCCLDPVTARKPRGGLILSIVWEDVDTAEPIWGWPKPDLDNRPYPGWLADTNRPGR